MGPTRGNNMLGRLALFGLLTAANAMELSKANFDDAVVNSGKNAFVKFLAPW